MLISHYQHLVNQEGLVWGPEAANRGASERLVPILMTALVTGLGLLPLAMYSAAPDNEIEGPMAIMVLGGLITSTALNLLILPTLALHFGRFKKKTGDPSQASRLDLPSLEDVDRAWSVGATHRAGLGAAPNDSRIQPCQKALTA